MTNPVIQTLLTTVYAELDNDPVSRVEVSVNSIG